MLGLAHVMLNTFWEETMILSKDDVIALQQILCVMFFRVGLYFLLIGLLFSYSEGLFTSEMNFWHDDVAEKVSLTF